VASRLQYVDVSDRVILLCDSARNRSCYPSIVSPSFISTKDLYLLITGLPTIRNQGEERGMRRSKLAKSLTPTDLLLSLPFSPSYLPFSWSSALRFHSNFFLFSTAMLIAPIGVVFFLTLKSWHNLPFWMSSDPPRTRSKPACYYFIEDVGAVDFEHGREWRKRVQARWVLLLLLDSIRKRLKSSFHSWAASPPFRKMCWEQTLYWAISAMIYTGVIAAVNWTTPSVLALILLYDCQLTFTSTDLTLRTH